MKLHFSQIFSLIKNLYHCFPLEVIEYDDNIILNKLNTYRSALLLTIHMLELMTLSQQTAFVFQLVMAWQVERRTTNALDLNFSQLTLVES